MKMGKTTIATGTKASRPMKRSPPSSSDDGLSVKRQKTDNYDWADEKVGYKMEKTAMDGIQVAYVYERKQQQPKLSMKDIRNLINGTSELNIDRWFLFYKGFKNALCKLLSDVEVLSQPVLLIHGVAKIGKTSLAMCLAYYLALEGGSAAYIKMKYDQVLDKDVATESLGSYFSKSSWVILDQCNVNCIDPGLFNRLASGKSSRGIEDSKMPIIMFTSGHYVPRPNWTKNRRVHFKVISLSVDAATVDQLKEGEGIQENEVSSEDVLKVSSIIGHVYECLYSCLSQEVEPMSFEQLDQVIYQINDLQRVSKEFFWLLWPELFQGKLQDIQEKLQTENLQPEKWKIQPYQVQFLGLILTGERYPQDEKQNVFLNWLSIRGEMDESKGYCEYESESYYYYLPRLARLHDILTHAYQQCSPENMYRKFSELFKDLTAVRESGNEHLQAMRDYLFENMVGLLCKTMTTEGTTFGLWTKGHSNAELTTVDDVVEVSSVQGLCEKTEEIRSTNENRCLWCVLNVACKRRFPGYDFAYVQVVDSKYKEFQLFQVTVNPLSHGTDTMYTTLSEIQSFIGSKLPSGTCDVVEPYFLVPHGTAIGYKKKIEMRHRGKNTGVYVPVVFLLPDQRTA